MLWGFMKVFDWIKEQVWSKTDLKQTRYWCALLRVFVFYFGVHGLRLIRVGANILGIS